MSDAVKPVTSTTPTRTAASWSGDDFRTETKCPTNSQVDGKEPRTGSKVSRNDELIRRRILIKHSEARGDHSRLRRIGGEGGALCKQRIAVRVAADGDIEGPA